MTSRASQESLLRRVNRAAASLTLPPEAIDRLEGYVDLLRRWNAKINLTALPLDPLTDEAVDRLLVEPIVAARHLVRQYDGPTNHLTPAGLFEIPTDPEPRWFDIGSGGGYPAISLKLAGLGTPRATVADTARD